MDIAQRRADQIRRQRHAGHPHQLHERTGLLAEKMGADIEQVRVGIGSDPRIGTSHFLYAGCGYGGSCFPKDVKALIKTASDEGRDLKVLKAVEAANDRQKLVLVDKIVKRFGENSAASISRCGAWRSPNTDDMREATSRVVLAELFQRGATVTAYDPVAMPETQRIFDGEARLKYADTPNAALEGADALVIVTEWKEFRSPDFDRIKSTLKTPDHHRWPQPVRPRLVAAAGLDYDAIGRGLNVAK